MAKEKEVCPFPGSSWELVPISRYNTIIHRALLTGQYSLAPTSCLSAYPAQKLHSQRHKSPVKIVPPLQRERKEIWGVICVCVCVGYLNKRERCSKWFTTPLWEQARPGESNIFAPGPLWGKKDDLSRRKGHSNVQVKDQDDSVFPRISLA